MQEPRRPSSTNFTLSVQCRTSSFDRSPCFFARLVVWDRRFRLLSGWSAAMSASGEGRPRNRYHQNMRHRVQQLRASPRGRGHHRTLAASIPPRAPSHDALGNAEPSLDGCRSRSRRRLLFSGPSCGLFLSRRGLFRRSIEYGCYDS